MAQQTLEPGFVEWKATGELEHKTVPASGVTVLDEEQGIVEAFVSVTGLVDRVKDNIHPGAYEETLRERTPKGVHAHDWSKPVSKALEVEEVAPGDPRLPKTRRNGQPWPRQAGAVRVKQQYNLETQLGRDTFSNVKFFGPEQEWSIGYKVPPRGATLEQKSGTRNIHKIEFYEYSDVLFGAMPEAHTAGIKDDQGGTVAGELHGEPAASPEADATIPTEHLTDHAAEDRSAEADRAGAQLGEPPASGEAHADVEGSLSEEDLAELFAAARFEIELEQAAVARRVRELVGQGEKTDLVRRALADVTSARAALAPEVKADGKPDKASPAERLKDYWRRNVSWGHEGDFAECVAGVSKHMTPDQAKGYCNLRHKEATGHYPGESNAHGKSLVPQVVVGGELKDVHTGSVPGVPTQMGKRSCVECGEPASGVDSEGRPACKAHAVTAEKDGLVDITEDVALAMKAFIDLEADELEVKVARRAPQPNGGWIWQGFPGGGSVGDAPSLRGGDHPSGGGASKRPEASAGFDEWVSNNSEFLRPDELEAVEAIRGHIAEGDGAGAQTVLGNLASRADERGDSNLSDGVVALAQDLERRMRAEEEPSSSPRDGGEAADRAQSTHDPSPRDMTDDELTRNMRAAQDDGDDDAVEELQAESRRRLAEEHGWPDVGEVPGGQRGRAADEATEARLTGLGLVEFPEQMSPGQRIYGEEGTERAIADEGDGWYSYFDGDQITAQSRDLEEVIKKFQQERGQAPLSERSFRGDDPFGDGTPPPAGLGGHMDDEPLNEGEEADAAAEAAAAFGDRAPSEVLRDLDVDKMTEQQLADRRQEIGQKPWRDWTDAEHIEVAAIASELEMRKRREQIASETAQQMADDQRSRDADGPGSDAQDLLGLVDGLGASKFNEEGQRAIEDLRAAVESGDDAAIARAAQGVANHSSLFYGGVVDRANAVAVAHGGQSNDANTGPFILPDSEQGTSGGAFGGEGWTTHEPGAGSAMRARHTFGQNDDEPYATSRTVHVFDYGEENSPRFSIQRQGSSYLQTDSPEQAAQAGELLSTRWGSPDFDVSTPNKFREALGAEEDRSNESSSPAAREGWRALGSGNYLLAGGGRIIPSDNADTPWYADVTHGGDRSPTQVGNFATAEEAQQAVETAVERAAAAGVRTEQRNELIKETNQLANQISRAVADGEFGAVAQLTARINEAMAQINNLDEPAPEADIPPAFTDVRLGDLMSDLDNGLLNDEEATVHLAARMQELLGDVNTRYQTLDQVREVSTEAYARAEDAYSDYDQGLISEEQLRTIVQDATRMAARTAVQRGTKALPAGDLEEITPEEISASLAAWV